MTVYHPTLYFLRAGTAVIIRPGVVHNIVAAAGDYEHAVLQVPSTFQYGLQFKVETPYECFGVTKEKVLEVALRGLQRTGQRHLTEPIACV